MAERALFEGFGLQAVDDKGRVAIPADMRAAIERNSDVRMIVVGRNPFDPCLNAHDLSWSQEKLARIDDPAASPYHGDVAAAGANARAKRSAFGNVERCQFDASGRFVIPPFFRAKAQIGKWAFFTGAAETFDIWAPEVLLATDSPELEDFREMCAFKLAEKGVVS